MEYLYKKKGIIILIVLIISCSNLFAQYVRGFRVIKGNSISFLFNTETDFQTGITLTGWTELEVTFFDVDDGMGYIGNPANRWRLTLESLDAEAVGTNPINTIPLTDIEYHVDCLTGTPIAGWPSLAATFGVPNGLDIIWNGNNDIASTQTVTISFRILSATGYPKDIYMLNLKFLILEWP